MEEDDRRNDVSALIIVLNDNGELDSSTTSVVLDSYPSVSDYEELKIMDD